MISSISSARYLTAIANGRTSCSGQGTDLEIAEAGDRMTISEVGRTASAITGKIAKSGSISLGSFNEQLQEDTRFVEEKLQALYRKLGIDPETEMTLSVGYDGNILVNGQGGKAQELADAVNADEEMANTVRRMSGTAALLEAARKHQEFAEAYAENPQQAVERFGYLLEDGHDYHVSFAFSEGQLDTSVTYV